MFFSIELFYKSFLTENNFTPLNLFILICKELLQKLSNCFTESLKGDIKKKVKTQLCSGELQQQYIIKVRP
jgi:hypothetical protein